MRIVFTDDAIYFGVICFVAEPTTIILSDARRDSSLVETDSFQIVLDTYRDHENGFVFGTNPAGLEYDGQLTNEGEGSGGIGGGLVIRSGSQQQRGSGGGFNLNWDGVWRVATEVTDVGWTAEFVIPFRTLRYASGAAQTWGINFQRNIRHRNEQSYWAPLPRQFNLNRLSLAGELRGLEVTPPRNLELNPYLLGQTLRGDEAQLRFRIDQGAPLSLEFFSVFGGLVGGRRSTVGPRLSLRLGERFKHAGLVGPQRSRSARRRVHDQPDAAPAQLLVHDPRVRAGAGAVQRPRTALVLQHPFRACSRTPTPGSSSSTTTSRASTATVRPAPGGA